MKVLHYNQDTCLSTIEVGDEDLSLIVSILGGIAATWSEQDPTILGLTKERFEKLEKTVREAFGVGSAKTL